MDSFAGRADDAFCLDVIDFDFVSVRVFCLECDAWIVMDLGFCP